MELEHSCLNPRACVVCLQSGMPTQSNLRRGAALTVIAVVLVFAGILANAASRHASGWWAVLGFLLESAAGILTCLVYGTLYPRARR